MCRITIITSLFNCDQYLEGYFEAVGKIENKNEIEILLIHNAPRQEEMAIINKYLPRLPCVKHIVVPEREGLYVSWNRGILASKGKYLTNWNVDDIRLPHSFIDQADALDKETEAALAYGEFVIISEYGNKEGKLIVEPEFDRANRTFFREFHITCFPMWRKEIHAVIGYFDEQFKAIADFDFQIRVASTYPLIKVNKHLGYYLEGTPGNLSSNTTRQDMERTALHFRYGNFDLLHLTNLPRALQTFKIFKYKWAGNYHSMKRWTFSDFCLYAVKSPLLLISLLKFPRHIARMYLKPFINKISPKTKAQVAFKN